MQAQANTKDLNMFSISVFQRLPTQEQMVEETGAQLGPTSIIYSEKTRALSLCGGVHVCVRSVVGVVVVVVVCV
jgi:hypothetical protein